MFQILKTTIAALAVVAITACSSTPKPADVYDSRGNVATEAAMESVVMVDNGVTVYFDKKGELVRVASTASTIVRASDLNNPQRMLEAEQTALLRANGGLTDFMDKVVQRHESTKTIRMDEEVRELYVSTTSSRSVGKLRGIVFTTTVDGLEVRAQAVFDVNNLKAAKSMRKLMK